MMQIWQFGAFMMSFNKQVICLLWLAAVLSVATDAQIHHGARRMLLEADAADTADVFEQYAGCAGPPYCPMDSSYWFCYKGSVRWVSLIREASLGA
jgi:hypothetical protein